MTNTKAAKVDLQMARRIIEEAHRDLEEGQYYRAVRKCQEVVELALKALLMFKGVAGYPKTHDIGKFVADTLKDDLDVKLLTEISHISDELTKERARSFYATAKWFPTEAYTSDDANTALQRAQFVFDEVAKSIGTFCNGGQCL
ncbi:MAG: HEPN domain-containing protein [Syntrophorhabdales bacterium]